MPHPSARSVAIGVSVALACGVPLLASPASAAPVPDTIEVQVLTINDFHGRIEANFENGEAGAAVLAGAVNAFEAENPNTLFVSAGDNIGASTFTSFIQQDNPTIDALVAAGLDLSAVGNHEFDAGSADLTDRVLPRYGSDVYGLGANVYLTGTDTPALPEYSVQTVDGVRIAFIGTVTEQTAAMVSPEGIADIEFGDQLEAANRVAGELTDADLADVIVLLRHEGSAVEDCDAVTADTTAYGTLIREASPEIDAIVSGHTHQSYSCAVPVDGSQLKAVLEEQWQPAGSSRPVLHLGVSEGFSYEYDPEAAQGTRIQSMTLNGVEVAPDDSFTVVADSFLAAGGDNFVTFAEGTDRADTGQIDLAATVAYFAATDVVDPAPLGRAAVVTPEPTPTPTPEPTPTAAPTAEPSPSSAPTTAPAPSASAGGNLATTGGGEFPIGAVVVAGILLLGGAGLLLRTRART